MSCESSSCCLSNNLTDPKHLGIALGGLHLLLGFLYLNELPLTSFLLFTSAAIVGAASAYKNFKCSSSDSCSQGDCPVEKNVLPHAATCLHKSLNKGMNYFADIMSFKSKSKSLSV